MNKGARKWVRSQVKKIPALKDPFFINVPFYLISDLNLNRVSVLSICKIGEVNLTCPQVTTKGV